MLGGELLSPFQKQVLKAFTGSKKARHVKSGQISLETMIELAKKKDPGLDEYYLAVAFEQSEKIPDDPSRLKVNLLTLINPKEMKNFFAAQAVQLLEKHRS